MRCFVACIFIGFVACASGNRTAGASSQAESTPRVVGTDIKTRMVDGQQMTTVDAPINRVWIALAAAYDSVGVPISVTDAKQRMLGNKGFTLRQKLGTVQLSKYIDCGGGGFGPNANSYDVYLSILSRLHADEAGRTELVTTVDAAARPTNVSQPYMKCGSKGEIESRIAELVQASLGRK